MNINGLDDLAKQAGPAITSAIKQASAKTGVNFSYLMEKAAAESGFRADVKAKTSSATGLFQFIESTWLGMVKKHGDKYGMGDLAAKIDDRGRVADKAVREQILELRKDPQKASFMAAEFAAENKAYLERHVGGNIGTTELYFAHFMGAGGASGFLNAMKKNPLDNAAAIFPKAAKANYNVFYDLKTGEARTLAQVYEFFDRKFQTSGEASAQSETLLSKAPPPAQKTEFGAAIKPQMRSPLFLENAVQDHAVRKFITHPALQKIMGDPDYQWSPFTDMARDNMVLSHAEILMMAQLSVPTEKS